MTRNLVSYIQTSKIKYANYVEPSISKNARFDLAHGVNRDNSNYPYWFLREQLLSQGIELNTPDLNVGRKIEFELHMNAMRKQLDVPAFVLLMEAVQICPANDSQELIAEYRRVFTWRDDLVDQGRYIKINFSNKFHSSSKFGWNNRIGFCCLIANNKSPAKQSTLDLYSERVKIIRWFECNTHGKFDLFGGGWEVLPPRPGRLGRLWHRVAWILACRAGCRAFPSYKGKVKDKRKTLEGYRFSVCYENVKDLPGYITEKIFDCFFAGCVPIYWGASNIVDHIPRGCFIDRREFESHEDLYQYLIDMTEAEYQIRQNAIINFLTSARAKPFAAEFFAKQITTTIISALDSSLGEPA